MTNRTFKINDVVQDAKATSTEIQQSMQHLTELRKLMRDALMDVEQALHQAQNCSDDAQFNSEMNYHVDDNQVIED